MFVDPPKPLGYNFSVAASAVTRRDNRQTLGAQAPSKGAFFMPRSPSMAGDAGQAARPGRVPSSRFVTPASFAALVVTSEAADSTQVRSLSA